MTLYELTEDYLRLIEMAETEDDPVAIYDTMESIKGNLEDKIDSYVAVCARLDADEEMVRAEVKRLTATLNTISNNKKHIKQRLMDSMIMMGIRKIKTALHTVSVVKNGGRPPILINDGLTAEDLPDNLKRVTVAPDMDMLRVMVEQGDTKYAHFGQRGEHLTIR